MKTLSFVLLTLLFLSCSRENPVEAPAPTLSGQWITSAHGYHLNVLFSQNKETVNGSGILTVDAPYSSNPVSIDGACLYPNVSLSIFSTNLPLTNFSGYFLNDSTIFGTLRGYVDAPMPITINRHG